MIKKQTPHRGRTGRAKGGDEKDDIYNILRHNPFNVNSLDHRRAFKALDRINAALNTIICTVVMSVCALVVALFGGAV